MKKIQKWFHSKKKKKLHREGDQNFDIERLRTDSGDRKG